MESTSRVSEQYSGTSTYKGARIMGGGGAGTGGNPSTAAIYQRSQPAEAAEQPAPPVRRPRRKGRGLRIGGIVLIILGIILVGLSVAVQESPTSVAIPAGSADVLSPPSTSLGSASFSVSWTGAAGGTEVYLVTGTPSCSGTPGGLVASGSGSSGSFTATLQSGTSYELYGCDGGSPEGLSVSWTATGLSLLLIIGIVVAVLGVLLLVLGTRIGKRAAAQEAAALQAAAPEMSAWGDASASTDDSPEASAGSTDDPSPPPA
jgi:uncharacterized membrane protein